MKSLKTLIATTTIALSAVSFNASATIVDIETMINTMSKTDLEFFKKAVSLTSETENQDVKWKSAHDSWSFVTAFPRQVAGQTCKEYQLTFMSGGYSRGMICQVSDKKWVFVE